MTGSEPGGGAEPALLRSALAQLRLDGAIFFRSELTDAFAFESTPLALVDALPTRAGRLTLFHIVAAGRCWVAADDGERHWASEGDVVVVPYGDRHTIGGATDAAPVSILDLVATPPWADLPTIRHGGGGGRTDLVCGYLSSDDPLFDPAMRVFPPAFVVRLPDGASSEWIRASVAYAVEASVPSDRSADPATLRLPELVLTEVLHVHLASAPAADHGWLAALHDPVLATALSLMHGDPARRWTVAELAAGAAVSRSLLDARFREVLGCAPIRYLTEWRMHLAEDLLATTDLGVFSLARRVGYESEEAFSRAFKRTHGVPPGQWRAERAPRSGAR